MVGIREKEAWINLNLPGTISPPLVWTQADLSKKRGVLTFLRVHPASLRFSNPVSLLHDARPS